MTHLFHRALDRMALFTALLAGLVIIFFSQFMQIALANIYINGVIIGATIFGIGLCFVQMFRLLPEHRWMRAYFSGRRNCALPPCLLRPVATILRTRPRQISATTLNNILDMILLRFEDSRESVRYITNTLVFVGLLGTFWGLILTIGGFAELISGLNFTDETVMTALQDGLAGPLSGMTTAFTSSLLGLGGSLAVGFLGLQVQLAQNQIFQELENWLASHTHPSDACDAIRELGLGLQRDCHTGLRG